MEMNNNQESKVDTYIKMRNKVSDTFTPFRIKDLSDQGNIIWERMVSVL